jgi:hypothetical protein
VPWVASAWPWQKTAHGETSSDVGVRDGRTRAHQVSPNSGYDSAVVAIHSLRLRAVCPVWLEYVCRAVGDNRGNSALPPLVITSQSVNTSIAYHLLKGG